jgi:menaquinone-dependent protoporphyrinogen oxidase
MRVLVAVASRHRTTSEIAEEIADVVRLNLTEIHGPVEVVVCSAEEVDGVDDFTAAIIGSGLSDGRWLEPARSLVTKHAAALAERPVWLFSSGPGLDSGSTAAEPPEVPELVGACGARAHRHFAGKVAQRGLSEGERAIVAVAHASSTSGVDADGDFRDWADVEAWATIVSYELRALVLARR